MLLANRIVITPSEDNPNWFHWKVFGRDGKVFGEGDGDYNIASQEALAAYNRSEEHDYDWDMP
jgi:hypothetical protein